MVAENYIIMVGVTNYNQLILIKCSVKSFLTEKPTSCVRLMKFSRLLQLFVNSVASGWLWNIPKPLLTDL